MKPLYEADKNFFDLLDLNLKDDAVRSNDILCLNNALKAFLNSGRKEDAFTVYFCFSEIFKLFGKGYDNTQKLLELLSDHEYHSGELLAKHRDHYSHSVYVFALGLAIYACDKQYRLAYLEFYHLPDNINSAFEFLKFWGITSLFHDIGYPFQLAHEQIKSYAQEIWLRGKVDKDKEKELLDSAPFVSYGNMDKFIMLAEPVKNKLKETFFDCDRLDNINDLLAYGLFLREGYDVDTVCKLLVQRVVNQKNFMDHGYFSAILLARCLFEMNDFTIDFRILDVLTAILLHNNFNKFDAPDKHPIGIKEHPLGYLLILCDELQCWDRLAYGKVSKRDPIAWDMNLEIFDNHIVIKYFYDSFSVRAETLDGDIKIIPNKNYQEMHSNLFEERILGTETTRGKDFLTQAELINASATKAEDKIPVYEGYIASSLKLSVQTEEVKKPKKSKLYVSDDSFINLCDLAKAIHNSYNEHCCGLSASFMDTSFGELSLEFKVSNIEQAKSYAEKLELINCFYSSKDLDYPVVNDFRITEFSSFKDNLGFLCREEHARWVKEKLAMGWKYGTDYKNKAERDSKKIHSSIVPFEELSDEERSKDELMVNNIIKLLRKFDTNIKIYNYRSGRKPNLEIAASGHRFFKGDSETIERYKREIKEILKEYSKNYRVVVHSCFAFGADQLIAECAVELGITIKAYLPMRYEDYIRDVKNDALANGVNFGNDEELKMRHLLAQTVVCRSIVDSKHVYAAASQYLIDKCKKLIVLWDGKETPLYDEQHNPINRGGTYDTICMAKKAKYNDSDIHIILCER